MSKKSIKNHFENLKVLKNNIVVQFLEPVNAKNEFDQTSSSGRLLVVEGAEKQVNKPRWCEVIAFGPHVSNVEVGDFAFLQPLSWTTSIMFNGERIWMTNDDSILAVTDKTPSLDVS